MHRKVLALAATGSFSSLFTYVFATALDVIPDDGWLILHAFLLTQAIGWLTTAAAIFTRQFFMPVSMTFVLDPGHPVFWGDREPGHAARVHRLPERLVAVRAVHRPHACQCLPWHRGGAPAAHPVGLGGTGCRASRHGSLSRPSFADHRVRSAGDCVTRPAPPGSGAGLRDVGDDIPLEACIGDQQRIASAHRNCAQRWWSDRERRAPAGHHRWQVGEV